MSAFTDAFEDLLDTQEIECGERLTATVDGVTADALIGRVQRAEILVAGGIADNGGASVQMRVSDFDAPPEHLSAVTVNGRTWSLLDYSESHGVYIITAGDPVADE